MSMPIRLGRGSAVAWRFDGFEALDTCHRETLRLLSQLDALVQRLGETGSDAQARATAAEIDRHFSITVCEHHEDEERHVFPALEASADAATRHAIACLRQDHFWLDTDWRELAPLVSAVASGVSCPDIDALRSGTEIFGLLCHDHIALEESLVYPQACAHMPEAARGAMNKEMATRRSQTHERHASR